jgi:hypothetical protein
MKYALLILISFSLIIVGGLFAHRSLKRRMANKTPRTIALILLWVAVIYVALPLTFVLIISTIDSEIYQGAQVPLSQYKGYGPSLPPGSREIHYYSSRFVTEAVFTIDEPALRLWASSDKRTIEEIRSAEDVRLDHLKVNVTIRAGLLIREVRAEAYFDRQSGLCYFQCRDR